MRCRVAILIFSACSLFGCDALSALFEDEAPADVEIIDSLEGVDLSPLTRDSDKGRWSELMSDLDSPCGDPITVVECIEGENSCAACVPAAQYLVRLVASGRANVDIREDYRHRYHSDPVELSLEGPAKGPEDAPLTIVEFSDFECPYCGMMTPILAETMATFDGRVRLVFKQYPLSGHERARPAARASIAAGKQGKFWEMHDMLFANQRELQDADLLRYAEALGLDLERFEADMEDPETESLIDLNRAEGSEAGVRGTPCLFVNGVEFRGDPELFGLYVAEALAGM